MSEEATNRILIEGITDNGEKFRPSDWAERMCCNLATIKNHRIQYSPLLHPIFKNGYKCVLVDTSLETKHPALYQSIIEFVKVNKLKMATPE